jgi:hypothetical protein
MVIGIALSISSGLVYCYRLIQFSELLRMSCPDIWDKYVTKGGRVNRLVRSNRLRSLPLAYESDNIALNHKLKSLALLYKSAYIGLS